MGVTPERQAADSLALGANSARVPFSWWELEPQRGQVDFGYVGLMDRFVRAVESHGGRVLFVLGGPPPWARYQCFLRRETADLGPRRQKEIGPTPYRQRRHRASSTTGAAARTRISAEGSGTTTNCASTKWIVSKARAVSGGGQYRLMAYDTATDSERDVLGATGNFFGAEITHDGSRIVYRNGGSIWIVNWDGSDNRELVGGGGNFTLSATYCYAAMGGGVRRVEIANPGNQQQVYSGDVHEGGWYLSVSMDDAYLGCGWGGARGLVNTANGSVEALAIAPQQ